MMSSEKAKAQVIWPMIEKLIEQKGESIVKKPPKAKSAKKGKSCAKKSTTTLN